MTLPRLSHWVTLSDWKQDTGGGGEKNARVLKIVSLQNVSTIHRNWDIK